MFSNVVMMVDNVWIVDKLECMCEGVECGELVLRVVIVIGVFMLVVL